MNCTICGKSLLHHVNGSSRAVFSVIEMGNGKHSLCGHCERAASWTLEKLEDAEMQNKENAFEVQVIAKGSFIDSATGDGNKYLVETIIIRMNHIALNEWMSTEIHDCRDCYETDEQWKAYWTDRQEGRKVVRGKILKALKIDAKTESESVSISQAESEIFTVVHIKYLEQ